ncbi:hypothetical protein WR25_23194 isoform D [Diploscapter pachys]|uniref:Tyrosine-protein phosphatase domain-containing protein n=1 Tax=Diploscapter pachys TaxID=2018661 RepID=A0A2A2K029_9BILA|nr:hypothetical protein WR25_23194 isoform B [Diploscapter pachys]PAV67388.1 hypothetical protein WR25_23194 isoform D [Diploscapter pachys]
MKSSNEVSGTWSKLPNQGLPPGYARDRTSSLASFMNLNGANEEDFGDMFSLATANDYPMNDRGRRILLPAGSNNAEDDEATSRFRKRVKQMARKETVRPARSLSPVSRDRDMFEEAGEEDGGQPLQLDQTNRKKKGKGIGYIFTPSAQTQEQAKVPAQTRRVMIISPGDEEKLKNGPQEKVYRLDEMKAHWKATRMKLFAARTAIDVQPELVERTRFKMEAHRKDIRLHGISPNAISFNSEQYATEQEIVRSSVGIIEEPVSEEQMRVLVKQCKENIDLTQHLLYSKKYDNKWKPQHRKLFAEGTEDGKKKNRPLNKQGWVLPLKKLCDKIGISTSFFTHNKHVTLDEAREYVLKERLAKTADMIAGSWLTVADRQSVENPVLMSYLSQTLDARTLALRLAQFKVNIETDMDRVRETGQYYNNIQLGKRMFAPTRKPKFVQTITGGMERRFEILDNQVNFIPFEHIASDLYKEKCRNTRVHCRDSTRVVLKYANYDGDDDFIHANRIEGGPLFSKFILTQAPMANTVGDFWRMIYQEKCPYIFMLISRKHPERCERYWPSTPSDDPLLVFGLTVENRGICTDRDPLFRITQLLITGPDGDKHHVEHWQADMNNSANLWSPLLLLRLARNCNRPIVVHDHLGISRAACLVAAEVAICNLIKGPSYKHPVQRAVQFVRSCRPFSVETPMQVSKQMIKCLQID